MSRPSKFYAKFFFTLLLLPILILLSQAACTGPQLNAAGNALAVVNNEIDASLENASELVISGQVETEDGRWQNDYVVLLFQNGEEVARTTTRLLDTPLSGKGPMDGVFELRVPNNYKLTEAHDFYDQDGNLITMHPVLGMVGKQYIGIWYEDLNPKDMRTIAIPEKQLEFVLVVLQYTNDNLPDSHLQGNVRLEGNVLITSLNEAVSDGTIAVQATAVPNPQPTPQSNIQFIVLPSSSDGLAWNLQMSGFYGNRWEVWERFIAGRVPGVTWESFKESVLVHNPQLEMDGFVFLPDKSYLLPLNQ